MRHPRYVSVAMAAAASLALAGCGGGKGGGQPGSDPAPAPATTGAATPMPGMPGMSASAADAAGQDAPAAANAIDIKSFAFAPANATVPVGTAVTWTNHDQDPHTVVTQPGAPGGGFRSGTLKAGDTFTFTFTAPGRYEYLCSIHPFMTATVTVTA
ncbi:cupredoxin domain-containing protein [Dactylosporangium sp. McL0621]|uniref:cupredoxin domain-containing protein n=1 Tax=Dactylosporangium sp. McL0621 TaxID=3415678 RepID=UPI003CEFB86C